MGVAVLEAKFVWGTSVFANVESWKSYSNQIKADPRAGSRKGVFFSRVHGVVAAKQG